MRYRPSFPAAVSLEPVGSVAVVDLESVCELYGRDTVPFPLGRSRPVGSLWLATRDVDPIEYRLDAGDLRSVRGWVEALMRPDVCVECRVHCSVGDRPDRRLHGVLADGSGFLAVQGSDEGVDIVDVYAVPPPELAAVVADTVGLVGAGAHQRIAVTGHTDQVPEAVDARDEADDLSFLVDHTVHPEPVPVVDDRDVVATGTVQTRTEPARQWGVDPDRRILHWVQVRGDGDYIYEPDDADHAEPLDAGMLRSWIEGFIADDMEALRSRRGQW
ncbi:MAG: hypothetical protein SW019_15920 [Actinomycetota bacterium]|nr:hypothetical protein [Actinomycetota bacterium]